MNRFVYWLGIGNAKDKPYKRLPVRQTHQQTKGKKTRWTAKEGNNRAIFHDILGRTTYKFPSLCRIYQGKLVQRVHTQRQKWLMLTGHWKWKREWSVTPHNLAKWVQLQQHIWTGFIWDFEYLHFHTDLTMKDHDHKILTQLKLSHIAIAIS